MVSQPEWKLTFCQRAQRTEPPRYIKGPCLCVTSSCLSLSTCKQGATISRRAQCHWVSAPLVLWSAPPVQCQMSVAPLRRKDRLPVAAQNTRGENQTAGKSARLFRQDMFKRWNIVWKFRWAETGVLMIHPYSGPTVSISLTLSEPILSSALSLYIAAMCSRASASSDIAGPV